MLFGIQGQHCGEFVYQFVIKVPKDYPEKPPIMRFITKIVLPNNSIDSHGYVRVDRLPNFRWQSEHNIADLLVAVREAMKDRASTVASSKLAGETFFTPASGDFPERDFQ